ncbi:hypothetical protein [Microbacterium plantarum]|uniref:Uncharacterized protein n=1 Tax=Microbacterium plantarum TaxID=1816425 RepID=A0ABV5EUC8_9MICO
MSPELSAVLTGVQDVINQRATLMETAQDTLRSMGHATLILDCRNVIPNGERVYIDEIHSMDYNRSPSIEYRVNVTPLPRVSTINVATWRWALTGEETVTLRVSLGTWQVVLSDEKRHLLVQLAPDEIGHRRSIPKLRNWAGKSDLRVRARGDHMQLIDPLGYVAHEGTIASAFRWLCGYENPAGEVAA